MEWFTSWTGWLIIGFVILILEIFIPGIYLMWWGFSAIIVSGITLLFPEISLSVLVIIFAITALGFSLLWWKYQHSQDQQEDKQTCLNTREHFMLRQYGVVEEILANGSIRAKFGDTTWRVVGQNLNVKDKIQVVDVSNITLYVVKIPSTNNP